MIFCFPPRLKKFAVCRASSSIDADGRSDYHPWFSHSFADTSVQEIKVTVVFYDGKTNPVIPEFAWLGAQYAFTAAQLSVCIFELEKWCTIGAQKVFMRRSSMSSTEKLNFDNTIWNEKCQTDRAQLFRNWLKFIGGDALTFLSYIRVLGCEYFPDRYVILNKHYVYLFFRILNKMFSYNLWEQVFFFDLHFLKPDIASSFSLNVQQRDRTARSGLL